MQYQTKKNHLHCLSRKLSKYPSVFYGLVYHLKRFWFSFLILEKQLFIEPFPQSEAHLQHYRTTCVKSIRKSKCHEYMNNTILDTTIWKVKDAVIEGTKAALKDWEKRGLLFSQFKSKLNFFFLPLLWQNTKGIRVFGW